ncbi:MAG: hypothetical protein WCH10_04285 [bacterium]|jgi:hypothetical protein
MPKVATFLDDAVVNNLKELCNNSDKSLSKTIAELVDIGYKVKLYHEKQQLNPEKPLLPNKHTEYLLRIMAIATDIYRCARNGKSKYKEDSIDDVLVTIATNTQNFINSEFKENQ